MLCPRLLKLRLGVRTFVLFELDELWNKMPDGHAGGINEFSRSHETVEFGLDGATDNDSVYGKSSSEHYTIFLANAQIPKKSRIHA